MTVKTRLLVPALPSTSDTSLIDMVAKPCATAAGFALLAEARTSTLYVIEKEAAINSFARVVAMIMLFKAPTSLSKDRNGHETR